MSTDSQNDDERANRLSFYFFLSTLVFALLAALWLLFEAAFL